MCPPQEATEKKHLNTAAFDAESIKKSSGDTNKKWLTRSAQFVAFLVIAFPCLISEVIGGWTKQYTSPVLFPTGKLDIPSQSGKVVIVTGANTGIGYETSIELAQAGAHVIVACRSESKAKAAMESIYSALDGREKAQLTFIPLDLSSLRSVQDFAAEFQKLKLPLDTLVLNAGVMKSPGAEFIAKELTYGFDTTKDGLEYHIGVNHVAHFYLTQLLLDSMASGGRVVAVSSMAEQGSYENGFLFQEWKPVNGEMPATYEDGKAYGQSKLANLLFVRELAEQCHAKNRNITAYSCHPGVIKTDLTRYMTPILEADMQSKSMMQRKLGILMSKWFEMSMFNAPGGALTQLHLATADVSTLENGAFYHPVGRPVAPFHPQGSNSTLQKLLWEETERTIQQLISRR